MAGTSTIGGSLGALRNQLLSKTYDSTTSKETALGAASRCYGELTALGVALIGDAGTAVSVGDALGAMRQQIAALPVSSTFGMDRKQQAFGRLDALAAALSGAGVSVT